MPETSHIFSRNTLLCLLLSAPAATAQTSHERVTTQLSPAMDSVSARAARAHLDMHEGERGTTLRITVGHSLIFTAATPLSKVFVGSPSILGTFTAKPRELVLTAKAPGTSSLVVWDTLGRSCLYIVESDLDSEALQESLRDSYPTAKIDVKVQRDRIMLKGTVPTQEIYDGAAKAASAYGKDIANSLLIVPAHRKQVQLKLRIVEVDRTRMEQYGFNFFTGGKVPVSVSTQQFTGSSVATSSGGSAAGSDPLNIFLYSQTLQAGVTIKDLEQKNILQVLAEPTLTAMSGESARFLSGGEFPFPVVQGGTGNSTAISIMFRPYGVKVDFAPTVNSDGSIRIKVAPEVSTLDFSNAVTISGFTIPALSTRRAETEVEIRSGQTFAVSGLLDHRTTESMSRLPGISNIPILGQLFRSKAYSHSITELVVLVTATVVDPLTDTAVPVEPTPAVPNLDPRSFDQQLRTEQRVNPAPTKK